MLEHPDIIMLSDEIYERIVFDGNSNVSPASYSSIRDRVITLNGFSKATAMTGWRCGYLATTPEIAKVIYKLYQHTISCVSGFIQKASVVALKCTDEIEAMRRKYEMRRNLFIGGLNKIPGVSAKSPQGAFYAWVKFEWNSMNSEEVCDYILNNAKVVAVPGIAYGTEEPFLRFSFAESDEKLAETVRRIAAIAPGAK
jgi:aspartate aminotransferase